MENTMSNLKKLAELYYELISHDHHKDKDCHFYITFKVSSYEKDTITVQHFGYINEFKVVTDSYEKAVEILKQEMLKIIIEESAQAIRVNSTPDEYDCYVVSTERALEIQKEAVELCA
jgi:hypothetical protein